MIASDLDGDGIKEFYVSDYEGVFRLDTDGQIVWRSDVKLNNYLFTLPAEGECPAAVLTDRGIWDSKGNALQRGIKSSVGTYMLQPVKWGDTYCLAAGETSQQGGHVFIFDLAGKTVFKQSIGDWGVNDILAVRFKRGEAPYLVVVGGRGLGSKLMELNIFSHGLSADYLPTLPREPDQLHTTTILSFLGITGILLAIVSVAFGLNSWVLALYLLSVFFSHTAELMRPPLVLLLAPSRIDPSLVHAVTRAASPHRFLLTWCSLERYN